jgi:orotate phosphoribosyltransferase
VSSYRTQAVDLIRQRGYEYREEPFKLASGELSHDYIDGKYAIDSGSSLRLVSHAIVEVAASRGMEFDTVGGLTMGADAIAHGVALTADVMWFSVRKEPKTRGREQQIEGARLSGSNRVLLVDDVVTSGGSIMDAYRPVAATGATIVGVIPLVDRSDLGRPRFEALGIPYEPLCTYVDLGIAPVHGSGFATSTRA